MERKKGERNPPLVFLTFSSCDYHSSETRDPTSSYSFLFFFKINLPFHQLVKSLLYALIESEKKSVEYGARLISHIYNTRLREKRMLEYFG